MSAKINKENVLLFVLRYDAKAKLYEGEAYGVEDTKDGIVHPYISGSLNVYNEDIFLCFGKKAVKEGYDRLNAWLAQNGQESIDKKYK